MRKNNTIALAALSVLVVAFSCAKEKDVTPTEQATPAQEETVAPEQSGTNDVELVPFSFSIAETKTYIDDSGTSAKVVWEEGESIAVYDGFGIRKFTMTSLNPLKFEGEIAADASFAWAVYPYAESGISATASTVTASLPATQVLSGENAAKGALLTAGKINMENKSVTLLNLHGLVSFTIGHDDIAALSVKGTNLAGSATFTEGGVLSGEVSSPESEIVLTPDGETFTKGSVVYIAAFPGATITAVSAKRTDGYKGTKSGLSKTLARNKGLNAGTLDNMAIDWVYEASNADELLAWHAGHTDAAMKAAKADYPNATNHKLLLTGDIDMSGKTWAYKHLRCEFDGAGHKIYNLVISRATTSSNNQPCFFNEVYSDIHDVVFGSSDGVNYDGISRIENTTSEAPSYWCYATLFQLANGSNTFENISNFIPVSIAAGAVGKFRLSGILGAAGKSDKEAQEIVVRNCVNKGTLTDNTTTLSTNAEGNMIGGIVCVMNNYDGDNLTIKDCTNEGDISSVQPAMCCIGGICGRRYNNTSETLNKLVIDRCINLGNITHTNTSSECAVYIGGIMGLITQSQSTPYFAGAGDDDYYMQITNCINGNKNGGDQPTIKAAGIRYSVGGIVGKFNASYVYGCTNYANVMGVTDPDYDIWKTTSSTKDAGGKIVRASTPVGGIAGAVGGMTGINSTSYSGYINPWTPGNPPANAVLDNCRNEGAISGTFRIGDGGSNDGACGAAAGGIVGSLRGYKECNNNVNIGSVTASNYNNYSYAGGIAGLVYRPTVSESGFSGNKNSGVITTNKVSSNSCAAGGVVAKLMGSIDHCENYGNVGVGESTSVNTSGSIVGMVRGVTNTHVYNITDCKVGLQHSVRGIAVSSSNYGLEPTGYSSEVYTWNDETKTLVVKNGYFGYKDEATGLYKGLFMGQANMTSNSQATLSGASTVATAPTL